MTRRNGKRRWRDFTSEATQLFENFAVKHDLSHTAVDDAPIEVLWLFPTQQKLRYPIALGLQNGDELNFGVGEFWSYFFPFTEKRDEFERVIDSWVDGRARVILRAGLIIQAIELQVLANGEWTTAYSAGSISLHKPVVPVLSNIDDR